MQNTQTKSQGEAIKLYRIANGELQKDIANLLNISAGTYSKKENGSIKISLEEATVLAKHYGTTVERLFSRAKTFYNG